MNNLCTDIGYLSVNKYGEELCGDHVDVVEQGDNSDVVVLADGMGSGVKACILSTLTAKIISTMMAQNMSIADCVSTIAATLPVCQEREVAYSTFTIIHIVDGETAELIQFDNPHVILLREGRNIEYDKVSEEIGGKTIYKSRFALQRGDALVAMSDGAIHAGVERTLNFGWLRENIIDFLETMYDCGFTAKTISTILLDECVRLYGGQPGDDTTVCTVKVRGREPVNLMIGPPRNPDDVPRMMSLFFGKQGKHIVCGGTTSNLAADYLGETIDTSLEYCDPEIPPIAKINGVDLVTEGVITINKVLTYAQNYLEDNKCYSLWSYKKDGASRICRLLFEEATDINFFVGRAMNPAHQNPDLPINFSIKMRLVEELTGCLEKMGKHVKVNYF